MQSAAYINIPQHTTTRVSLGRLSVIVASLAFWATMVVGLAVAVA